MREAKGSSEGPKTKIEKRNRLGGNPRARHIWTHPHGIYLWPGEFARIEAKVRAEFSIGG